MIILALVATTLYGVMTQFQDHVVFYFSPSELMANPQKASTPVRLGGLIEKGSLKILSQQDRTLQFVISDGTQDMVVVYSGFLPDLFREGQGLVAQGTYDPQTQVFKAHTILAKHDATYRPPDVRQGGKKALEQASASLQTGGESR